MGVLSFASIVAITVNGGVAAYNFAGGALF
jgi:hypothetical protein